MKIQYTSYFRFSVIYLVLGPTFMPYGTNIPTLIKRQKTNQTKKMSNLQNLSISLGSKEIRQSISVNSGQI